MTSHFTGTSEGSERVILHTSLKVKRSEVKVARPLNAVIENRP